MQAAHIAISYSTILVPYNSFRFIADNRDPSVQPIVIGEVLRRIIKIGKLILTCVTLDIMIICGNQQLCVEKRRQTKQASDFFIIGLNNTDYDKVLFLTQKLFSIF